MNIVTFVAGLVAGIVIGRRRGRAEAPRTPEESPGPDSETLHRERMEAILRGDRIPTPEERRMAEEWRVEQRRVPGE